MSDQGIVSLGEGVTAAKDLYKDVKRTMIDPAITAVKDGATMYMDGKIPYTIPSAVNTLKDSLSSPQGQMMTKTTEFMEVPQDERRAGMLEQMAKKEYEYAPKAFEDFEIVAERQPKMPFADKKLEYAKLDPRYVTKIKGMISPTGIQQNTSVDQVRYDRDAAGSEFKGVKAKSKPAKSLFNITAEEAMQDL